MVDWSYFIVIACVVLEMNCEITCNNYTFAFLIHLFEKITMKFKGHLFILCSILVVNCAYSQSVNENSAMQDSLGKLSSMIWKQKTDSDRLTASNTFFSKFLNTLQSVNPTIFTLDSIPGITRVASDDGKLRIFTWNIPFADGSNKYFGFIQLINDSSIVIPLKSVTNNSNDFSTAIVTPQNWYGALYFKLIEVKTAERTLYTLLGWDGYTKDANRKIIDVISFDKVGLITFGMPVFKTENGVKTRVVFEYAEKASFLLRYDYQAIRVEKRKKIKKENTWIIVMDRLVPIDPTLKGLRKYYVPAGDTYDGYIFRDNYWVLVEDIEVANKESKYE